MKSQNFRQTDAKGRQLRRSLFGLLKSVSETKIILLAAPFTGLFAKRLGPPLTAGCRTPQHHIKAKANLSTSLVNEAGFFCPSSDPA